MKIDDPLAQVEEQNRDDDSPMSISVPLNVCAVLMNLLPTLPGRLPSRPSLRLPQTSCRREDKKRGPKRSEKVT